MARSVVLRSAASLFVLSSAFACSSLLGIENPSDGGTGGEGGEKPSSGGKVGSSGGESSSGGAGPSGGKIDGSSGGRVSGGSANGTGGAMGGESPGGGSGGMVAADPTVRGRIVDLFGRPITSVEVRITGADPVVTDSQGKFVTEDAPANYDLEFRFSSRLGEYYQTVYRFIGLTRRDPLLQADRAVGESEATIEVVPANLPQPTGDLDVSVGHPADYWFTGDETGLTVNSAIDYDGTDPFPLALHALYWKSDYGASAYYGYAHQDILLNDGEATEVKLESWIPISQTGQLAGQVQVPEGTSEVEVTPYVNFADGASLRLQSTTASTGNAFSVPVPDIGENETFGVRVAVYGDGYNYSLAHADGLALGASSTNINLTIPSAPILQAPLSGTTDIDGSTEFRWTKSSAGPCSLFVVNSNSMRRLVRIVTCESSLRIPAEYFNGYFTPEGTDKKIYWGVQYHGPFQNVDEMTGPNEFHDAHYDGPWTGGYPRGKNRPASGVFATSTYSNGLVK